MKIAALAFSDDHRARAAAYGHRASLRKGSGRDRRGAVALRILHDARRSTVQIRVHVRVPALEIPLDQQLVLLSVAPGQHKDVFRGDEPVELFEPHHLPRTSNARSASETPAKGLQAVQRYLACLLHALARVFVCLAQSLVRFFGSRFQSVFGRS